MEVKILKGITQMIIMKLSAPFPQITVTTFEQLLLILGKLVRRKDKKTTSNPTFDLCQHCPQKNRNEKQPNIYIHQHRRRTEELQWKHAMVP